MINYLAPGYSYDKFVKAHGCTMTKGFFPYEWLDGYDKLFQKELPERKAFYSALKKTCISEADYAYCQTVWQDNIDGDHD